jgi:hypothetical protein
VSPDLAERIRDCHDPVAGDVVRTGRAGHENAAHQSLTDIMLVDELHREAGTATGTGNGSRAQRIAHSTTGVSPVGNRFFCSYRVRAEHDGRAQQV